jgi:hypothetical protein
VNATISIAEIGSADDLRSMRAWLLDTDGLRGRVNAVQRPPTSDELGPVLEAVLVAAGPGGAATSLAAALLTWIRHRTSDVNLKITHGDGTSLEISARRIQRLTADGLRTEIEQLSQALDNTTSATGRDLPDKTEPGLS